MKSLRLISVAAITLFVALVIPMRASAQITLTSLGVFPPTFVGPAATGCASPGCSLLTGPFPTPSVAAHPLVDPAFARPHTKSTVSPRPKVMPSHKRPRPPLVLDPTPPTVSCEPLGPGCDTIDSSSGGAIGVKGINAVDSGTLTTNLVGDIEPADQGLCAGNGYVVETNNIGEILIFNTALQRQSEVIPLDTVMGLTDRGWSSGGDPSCFYDSDNGGHWFFTQAVSASTEASGGFFGGCLALVASTCYEGIAVTVGSNPFGPYNVYFLNNNYNPSEPGYPFLQSDFAKIATSKDAFLLFYDEIPLNGGGLGGGFFNGAQELAFSKEAFEEGLPATDKKFTVAIENVGLLGTPDGTCFSDNTFHAPGLTCWYQVIPAQPPDPSEYYNPRGGTAFMLGSLDFYGQGDDRITVFNWTGLSKLNSANCNGCGGIQFGVQLFSGVKFYYGEGFLGAQKSGPIPLGDECGAAGLSVGVGSPPPPPPASCPLGGIATNGDGFTQVSQARGHIWGALGTAVNQTYSLGSSEVHQGALYFAIDFSKFNSSGGYSLTSQEYVSPQHEDLEFPAMAAGGTGGAIMTFTLSGNGGPTGADSGGFYPSTAYGRLTSTSDGLSGSVINIADLGESPQDGFTQYLFYPLGPPLYRPRWGDYSWAVYSGGVFYFATNYIQYPSCTGADFTLTIPTCGGTRNGFANWGTSVNSVVQ